MSTKATAARIYEYGEPDVFRFETMDVPDPVGHEVLVRNTVIGLNFVDIYLSTKAVISGRGVELIDLVKIHFFR